MADPLGYYAFSPSPRTTTGPLAYVSLVSDPLQELEDGLLEIIEGAHKMQHALHAMREEGKMRETEPGGLPDPNEPEDPGKPPEAE
jgi:hypothetical protein